MFVLWPRPLLRAAKHARTGEPTPASPPRPSKLQPHDARPRAQCPLYPPKRPLKKTWLPTHPIDPQAFANLQTAQLSALFIPSLAIRRNRDSLRLAIASLTDYPPRSVCERTRFAKAPWVTLGPRQLVMLVNVAALNQAHGLQSRRRCPDSPLVRAQLPTD